MKKRDLLEMIDVLTGVVKRQDERINTLQKAVNTLLERNPELVEPPKPKTLDQSVFDGVTDDWRWAAVDSNGRAAIYTHRPLLCFEAWDNATAAASIYLMLDGVFDATNWQSSLIQRDTATSNQEKPKTLDQSVFDGQDDDYRYAVISIEGGAFLFAEKPKIMGGLWSWDVAKDKQKLAVKLGTYDTRNWQNSLIQRESKPQLSGNERIKKLLEKQKLVMVRVSDDSYEDAAGGLDIFVCRMIEESGSHPVSTTSEDFWRYAIPIDNNGNEILDVDADFSSPFYDGEDGEAIDVTAVRGVIRASTTEYKG